MNKTGKGGFGDNKQNINREGRPPIKESVTEELRNIAEAHDVATLIWKRAQKDNALLRYVCDRMDGTPKQQIAMSGQKDMELLEALEELKHEFGDQAKKNMVELSDKSTQDTDT